MKRHLTILLFLSIFSSCTKNDSSEPGTLISPRVSIGSIENTSISGSAWKHILGGKADLEFMQKDRNGSLISTTKDSVNLKDYSNFTKSIPNGNYDITLISRNTSSVADTFISFNAEIRELSLQSSQALNFTAISKDGLITLSKEFIKDNTIPTFKTSAGQIFNLGFTAGFYYLYVKGGTKGEIYFISKTTSQPLSKTLDIGTNNQYNLTLTLTENGVDVIVGVFKYNEVPVTSSTLITIETSAAHMCCDDITFVLADEEGTILNSVKYITGYNQIKIGSKIPYNKERVNIFMINKPVETNVAPGITAYLHVKTGSIWNLVKLYQGGAPTYPLKVDFKNLPAFSWLTFSTDLYGSTTTAANLASTLENLPLSFRDSSKLFVQIEKGDKAYYNFFELPKGTQNFTVDISQVVKPSNGKTINFPVRENNYIRVVAKKIKNGSSGYQLTQKSFSETSGMIFQPQEKFQEYETNFRYNKNGFYYSDLYIGPEIPDKIEPFDVTYAVKGTSLNDFVPTFTGEFDFYLAQFSNLDGSAYVSLISPSTGDHSKNTLPDLSGIVELPEMDWNNYKLRFLRMYEGGDFKEDRFHYFFNNGYPFREKTMEGRTNFKPQTSGYITPLYGGPQIGLRPSGFSY